MMMNQPGFFDFEQRMKELGAQDPLTRLNELILWDDFRPILEKYVLKEAKAPGGRPRYDMLMMFKVLVLQRLYNLSDAQTEYQIRDRLSFMRFVGVDMHETIPDEKTIWRFREELRTAKILPKLWQAFEKQLKRLKIQAGTGKIVDASIVNIEKPSKKKRKKNDSDDEGSGSGEGHESEDQLAEPEERHRESQIDSDANWTVKRNKTYFGYKNHIKIDADTKLIESSIVTTAEVHDSQMFPDLLSESDRGCEIFADKGYAGMGCLTAVVNAKAKPRILHKAYRSKPISEKQKSENRNWSKIRARVEHIFGEQLTSMRFTGIRTVGFDRAEFVIQMNNLVYNIKRLKVLVPA